MLPDFLPAAETLAKGVKHIACYVADAISERRNAFSDDEAGDYLACAGADALAESLGRIEGDGPAAAAAGIWTFTEDEQDLLGLKPGDMIGPAVVCDPIARLHATIAAGLDKLSTFGLFDDDAAATDAAANPHAAAEHPAGGESSRTEAPDATPAGSLELPWKVEDLRDHWATKERMERAWGISDRWGVVIALTNTEAQAAAIVAALNPK